MDCRDSTDDELDLLELLEPLPTTKSYLKRPNPFENLYDDKFKERFRLNKSTVLLLLTEVESQLEYTSNRNRSLSPINQLLLTLRFLATGTFHLVVGDGFGVDNSTSCRIVHKVIPIIASLSEKYVRFPTTQDDLKETMKNFYNTAMVPGIVGAVDGTHVPIFSPGGEFAEAYRNRKGYFSLNVQLITDSRLYITDVVARWPGSVHDSTIFDFCHKRALFENGIIKEGYLIGDSGYSCSYLLTPILASPAEEEYNSRHVQARNCIERVNGVLKRRFGSLQYGLRINVTKIPALIVAAVVLHNIARIVGEEDPSTDTELEEYVETNRKNGTYLNFEEVQVLPPPPANIIGGTAQKTAVIHGHFADLI